MSGALRVVRRDAADYPAPLLDLERPPDPLYILGDLATLDAPRVTIVGTRDPTPYGVRVAHALAESFARAGACIVSGLARGIDATAHRAALAAGGRTAAVLGTGIDVPYPVGHRELHRAIAERGVVLSEMAPGTPAFQGAFPRRNRILAALSRATIVVEGGLKSGAIGTAEIATALGRDAAAVPGPIDSPQSAGANRLCRDGAQVIGTIEDALALMKLTPPVRHSDADFGPSERRILSELRRAPADLDSLAARTRLPARECMRAVTALELAGAVECELTGEIRRR